MDSRDAQSLTKPTTHLKLPIKTVTTHTNISLTNPKNDYKNDSQNYKIKFQSAYEKHLHLLKYYSPLQKSVTNSQTEAQILIQNHRFIHPTPKDNNESWGQRLARKYYNKLFKEYCLADLSKFKTRIGLRWRTATEVLEGKGQFICASLKCSSFSSTNTSNSNSLSTSNTNNTNTNTSSLPTSSNSNNSNNTLSTFEVNFGYLEDGVKMNALVKIRVCQKCEKKLFYSSFHNFTTLAADHIKDHGVNGTGIHDVIRDDIRDDIHDDIHDSIHDDDGIHEDIRDNDDDVENLNSKRVNPTISESISDNTDNTDTTDPTIKTKNDDGDLNLMKKQKVSHQRNEWEDDVEVEGLISLEDEMDAYLSDLF